MYITSHSTPLTPWQGKSPRELYLSDKEETLIAILLVNPPSPGEDIFLAKGRRLEWLVMYNDVILAVREILLTRRVTLLGVY